MSTTSANLFAASKSYTYAMKLLLPSLAEGNQAPAMPFYFLAGFAVELAFKAVILRSGSGEEVLRKLGHRLDNCYLSAQKCGFVPTDKDSTDRMVSGLNRTHRDFSFRYVPDVEVISVIGPGRILLVLAAMLAEVENQFDIWQDE